MGRGAWVEADGCRHHANEFAVIVGETSRARKGTSEKRVRPVWAYADPDWAAKKITHGLSSGEGLIWEIRDPILGTDKRTKQEIEIDPGVDDKRVLVIESEFGNVLRVLARDGNTLSSVLRLAWDSDDLRTMTKNNPARASSPHVSLIGHITQQELVKYLASVEVFNGLGNRHLWACVRRSKLLPFGGVCDQTRLSRLGDMLDSAVKQAQTLGPMAWADSGRELWGSEYGRLTEDRPGLWGAITSRAEAHVLRLALIFTLLDHCAEIEDVHIHAALALWRYCDRSAAYLFGASVGDRDADAILAALRSTPDGMTRTEIRGRHLPSKQDLGRGGSGAGIVATLRDGEMRVSPDRRSPRRTMVRRKRQAYAYALNAINAITHTPLTRQTRLTRTRTSEAILCI